MYTLFKRRILTDKKGKVSIMKLAAVRGFGVLCLSAALWFGFGGAQAAEKRWLSGYTYRKAIIITNPGSSELLDYHIKVTINTQELYDQGKLQVNGGDIRFTDSDGTTPIKYWLEKDGEFRVKVPLIPKENLNKVIYVYYGNSKAGSNSTAGMYSDVKGRKPVEPEPAVNIYAEQGNL